MYRSKPGLFLPVRPRIIPEIGSGAASNVGTKTSTRGSTFTSWSAECTKCGQYTDLPPVNRELEEDGE
jgi:hypothetical protein